MSSVGKWFGFDRFELVEEGLSAYDRGDFENAVEAFEAAIAEGADKVVDRDPKILLLDAKYKLRHNSYSAHR